MPQNITETTTYTTTIQSVADGDGATGANFLIAPQGLANRTNYLKAQIQNALLSTDNGIRAIRNYATVAALQGSTDHIAGTVVMVIATGGVYQYNATSSATQDSVTVITPTDVGAGSGRWVLLSPLNVAYGIPQLDSGNRIVGALPHYGLRFLGASAQPAGNPTLTSAYSNTGLTVTIPTVVAGDIIEAIGSYALTGYTSTGGNFSSLLAYNDGTSDTYLPDSYFNMSAAQMTATGVVPVYVRYRAYYVVPANKSNVTVRGIASLSANAVTLDMTNASGQGAPSLVVRVVVP